MQTDRNCIATTNNCTVSERTLPGIYQLKDLKHVKNYKHTLNLQREEITDLKYIIGCLNTNRRELWIPSKSTRTITDVHGEATDTVEAANDMSNVVSGDLNKYASLLLRSGIKRKATRLMLLSSLDGTCGIDIDDPPTTENTCDNNIGDELLEDNNSDQIRHFRPRMCGNRLVWAAVETGLQRSDVSTTGESVLRAPSEVFVDVLRDNAHLLSSNYATQKVCYKGAKRQRCAVDDVGEGRVVYSDNEANKNGAVGPVAAHSLSLREPCIKDLVSSSLARHCEGLADSALEMVLEFCLQSTEGSKTIGWEHVLRCVQSRAEEAARIGTSHVKMGGSARELLDLRLAPAVADRVTSRLLGLYGGARVPGASRAVPSVLNRGTP